MTPASSLLLETKLSPPSRTFRTRMSNARLHSALSNINSVQRLLSQLTTEQWQQCLDLIRRDMAVLSEVRFFGHDYPDTLQITVLFAVQRIAYHDQESGGASDIGGWCLDRWLRLLGRDSQNVQVLRGLAELWWLRSRRSFGRVQGGDSSSSDDAATLNRYDPNFVEARGNLLPAADYIRRAIDIARQEASLDGAILVTGAEILMNLGTVSAGRESQEYFQIALRYVRAAAIIPDFDIPENLQRFLDEFGVYGHDDSEDNDEDEDDEDDEDDDSDED